MKGRYLLILLILLIFPALLIMIKDNKVCFKNYCFNVEISQTPEEKSRGLMFRENLDSDNGMLFIFEKEGRHSFWMKNTLIPLDIIWINSNREVVYIKKEAQPCKGGSETKALLPPKDLCPFLEPDRDARYVLEINAGMADKLGIKLGDKADINI